MVLECGLNKLTDAVQLHIINDAHFLVKGGDFVNKCSKCANKICRCDNIQYFKQPSRLDVQIVQLGLQVLREPPGQPEI